MQTTGTHNLRLPTSAQLFTDDQLTKKFKIYATLDSDEQTVELTNLTYTGTDNNGVFAAPGRYYGCDISPASPPDLVSDSGSQKGFNVWSTADTFKLYYNLN